MTVWENIRGTFKQANHLVKLIYINIGVFVLIQALAIVFMLFNKEFTYISWLAVPADFSSLLSRFWTPFTYMFLHQGFFHLLFNILCLYWFGRMFLSVFSERQLVGLYIIGGFFAALFFVFSYNLFPYYSRIVHHSLLLGASGSIMAIIVATATRLPNMQIRLLLLGNVKLKYIAIVAILLSFFRITDSNAGGELAHLGGALMGYLFVFFYKKGTDITDLINKLIDSLTNLFHRPKMKVKKGGAGGYSKSYQRMSDAEYNLHKANTMKEIDRILDKIKDSGYDSLSEKEKKQLFQQGKK